MTTSERKEIPSLQVLLQRDNKVQEKAISSALLCVNPAVNQA
jgi:hypothetical protein